MARTTITSQPHPRLSDTVFPDREARRRRQQKRWTPSSPGPAPEVGHRCEGPRHKRPAADIQCPQTWQFTAGDGLPRWDSQGLDDLISVLGDSIHRYQPNRQISRLPERRRRRLPSPSGTRGGGQRRRDSDRGNEQVARYSSTASRGRVDQEDCIWEVMLGHGDTRVGLCRRSITQVSPSIALQ